MGVNEFAVVEQDSWITVTLFQHCKRAELHLKVIPKKLSYFKQFWRNFLTLNNFERHFLLLFKEYGASNALLIFHQRLLQKCRIFAKGQSDEWKLSAVQALTIWSYPTFSRKWRKERKDDDLTWSWSIDQWLGREQGGFDQNCELLELHFFWGISWTLLKAFTLSIIKTSLQ